ncbi:hypothetical protein [Chryseobacterium sediminis]|uniref:DUF4760 domain-containing protein n=1 Tax=Chryseobacterium sediminis TaxID=1679494 RepID=A0A5B2U9K3_9FLAO|nr:hypothetical protein [Chryseobacterium sediminis]KAA2223037.1 hypothetical protein FW780_02195 [Chryseobacterium sediminis]
MEDKLELLKASVPIATVIGVVVGAFLNSNLARKEKIRDHLFSYKVKSYSTIAESIIVIKRDLLAIRNDLLLEKVISGKKPIEIWDSFNKVRAEQALFMSDKTKHNFFLLEGKIFEIVKEDFFWESDPSKESIDKMIIIYENLGMECDKFIERIQRELGITKL